MPAGPSNWRLTLCWAALCRPGPGSRWAWPNASAPSPPPTAVIGAYWLSRQRAAQYQVLAQQGQWLDELTPLVLEHGPQAAVAMLQFGQQGRLAVPPRWASRPGRP